MRGRKRAITRFTKFRDEILSNYRYSEYRSNDFTRFLKDVSESQFELIIFRYCDTDESLRFDNPGLATVLYQVFRLADKNILLRDLENLADTFPGGNNSRNSLYEAIIALVVTDQISYASKDFDDSPSNTLQFFIKDE